MRKNFNLSASLGMGAIAACLAFAAPSFAEDQDISGAKQEMIQHFDERIADLNSAKSCIQAATDRESLKKCHSALHASHKEKHAAQKEKHQEKRKEKLAERIKKLEAERTKLEQ